MNRRRMIMRAVSATILLYIILHELGHCIVAVACGAQITEFSILTAHMSYAGGHFTDISDLWLHANGMAFPLILSYVYMLCYQKKRESRFYRIFSYFAAIMSMFSVLAWVIVPLLYLGGNASAGDDVTKFLRIFSTRYHPIWVTVGALILIMISVVLIIKKEIVKIAFMEMKGR